VQPLWSASQSDETNEGGPVAVHDWQLDIHQGGDPAQQQGMALFNNFVGNQLKITMVINSRRLITYCGSHGGSLPWRASVGLLSHLVAGPCRCLIRNGIPPAASPSTALVKVACTKGPGVPSANMP
jgi:hypothetical protein